jgi:hypothetical protein
MMSMRRGRATDVRQMAGTAGNSIKRKDNFRRHLQNIHKMRNADILDIDLEQYLVAI